MTNLIDSQAIWNLRPEWIPGQVEHTRDNIICIEVKVPLRGPDGNDLKKVECDKFRFPKIGKGQLVLFSPMLVQAGTEPVPSRDTGTKQQQRVDVDELRTVDPTLKKDQEEYNRAIKDFATSSAAKLDNFVADLDKRVEELAAKRAEDKIQPERESIARTWREHAADLEKYNEDRNSLKVAFSALATEQAYWDKEQQRFQNARQELEQDKLLFGQAGGPELLRLVRQADRLDDDESHTLSALEYQESPASLVIDLKEHLRSQNYSVDDPLLLQTLLCLCVGAATGQFVVLTGPPGSGKTSLVQKIARAVGAGSGVVPVRPAWIDASDLIGFYNPAINRYQPTPFLDYVLQARRYDELNRLYLLVLDEMNLGRVENYAADFLSFLEKAREDDNSARLQLYSREIENRLRAENDAALNAHRLTYPSRFPFPKGLVLLGTINVDETTHLPSPKFLDRSLTVQVSGTKLPEELVRPSNKAEGGNLSWALSLETALRCMDAGRDLTADGQTTWNLLMKWNKAYFEPLGLRLSHRLPQVYRCYMGAASVLNISDHRTVAETFVLSKIMPLVSFRDGDKSETSPEESKRNVLERWCNDTDPEGKEARGKETEFPHVHAALRSMLSRPGMIVRYLE